MPKFYKQNKKKIDPRYFLSETTAHEDKVSEGFLSKTFKPSEKNNIFKYVESGPLVRSSYHAEKHLF